MLDILKYIFLSDDGGGDFECQGNLFRATILFNDINKSREFSKTFVAARIYHFASVFVHQYVSLPRVKNV